MKRLTCRGVVMIATLGVAVAASGPSEASLARNAAGAKNIGNPGHLTLDTAGQLESDPDGRNFVIETGLQYQITRRFQLLAEFVPFESQRPNAGSGTSGIGDTDVTLSWLAGSGGGRLPTVVLGARAKLPTAGNGAIGTGKPDYAALFILGKELGELELSLETEYTTFGQSGGVKLRNQFVYAAISEYALNDFLAVYAELSGRSAPTAIESRSDVARIGVEVDIPVRERIAPYVSFEIDTETVAAIRAGIDWSW